jgi:hypothetical protein
VMVLYMTPVCGLVNVHDTQTTTPTSIRGGETRGEDRRGEGYIVVAQRSVS